MFCIGENLAICRSDLMHWVDKTWVQLKKSQNVPFTQGRVGDGGWISYSITYTGIGSVIEWAD